MNRPDQVFSAQASELVPFLGRTLPFSDLDRPALEALARACTIDFHPKGTRLLTQGVTLVEYVLLIRSGAVKLFLVREGREGREGALPDTLIDYRGEGAAVGALGVIREARASLSAETVEDTFCFKIPGAVFRALIAEHPAIAQYYLHNISENYIERAFSELRRQHADLCAASPLVLFSTRVGDVIRRPPLLIAPGSSLREAAGIMVAQGVGSLLVTDPHGEAVGIVTDKDLRRAVAEGEPHDAPVEFIMSSPLATIGHREPCFDALLRMMSAQIHHLAVLREGRVAGMVTAHDIMLLQGRSPTSLFREIAGARTMAALYPLAAKVPTTVGSLVEEGAKARNITRMVTIMNDLILEKLLGFVQEELGPAPVPFCWLLMGSEGRKEQTFQTDQDNALVYADCPDPAEAVRCEDYFRRFAEAAIDHLVRCGYPPCPGGMMASNPRWRMPMSRMRDFFETMVLLPEPEEVLRATIFFDFRPGWGQAALGETLRDHVVVHAARQDVFLRHLARHCLSTRPPLSFFRNIVVDKDGAHKDTLDLKTRALTPFVDFARLFALRHGLRETNTFDRLEALKDQGHIPPDLGVEALEAYEFLMQLRLVHQMARIDAGGAPDNHLNPATLSDLEKQTLKETFGVVRSLQTFVKEAFSLNVG
jgi:CBS domain-containing protein